MESRRGVVPPSVPLSPPSTLPFPPPPFFQGLAPATDRPRATASEKRQLVRREITPPHSSPPTHKTLPNIRTLRPPRRIPLLSTPPLAMRDATPGIYSDTCCAVCCGCQGAYCEESCPLEVTGGGPSDRGKATCVWALMRSRLRLGFVAKKEVDYVSSLFLIHFLLKSSGNSLFEAFDRKSLS